MTEQVYYNDQMPLAIYREMAAQLGLLDDLGVRLVPQASTQFDYSLSQIAGIALDIPQELSPTVAHQLTQVLQHYGDRYGGWHTGCSS